MDSDNLNQMNNSTFMAIMQELLDRLADKINRGNSTDNSDALKNIQKILEDMKNSASFDTQDHSEGNNQSTMDSRIVEAIRNTYSSGESSLLSEMEQEKTLLQEIADNTEEEKKDGKDVVGHLKDIANKAKHTAENLHRQFSSGNIELGGFSTFTRMMTDTESYYRNMVSMGQDFGGSMITMRNVMNQSGMTLRQFNDAIMSGSQGLRMLGPQTFSSFAHAVNGSVKALGDLGMTGDQLNQSMSTYIDGLRVSGRLNSMNSQQFMTSFREFSVNATQLAHELGISRTDAMNKLNEARAAPDVNILLRGLSEQQRGAIDHISAVMNNSPAMKSLMSSQLYTARVGAAPTMEVARTLAASGPEAERTYRQGAEILRRISSSTNNEDRRRLEEQYFRTLQNLGNNIGSAQGIASHYGNQYGNMAVELSGELARLNPRTIADNITNGPKNDREISGSDKLTQSVLQTNHTMQDFVNHYQHLTTALIESNQKFIATTIDAYNHIVDVLGKKIDDIGSSIIPETGKITNPLSSIPRAMGEHPWLTLGGLLAAHLVGGRVVGGLARTAINTIRPGASATRAASTSAASSSGGVVSAIRGLASRLMPSTVTSGRAASGLRAAASTTLSSGLLSTLGRVTGVLSMINVGSNLYSDYNAITKKAPDDKASILEKDKYGRDKWGAYGNLLGTSIFGGIGAMLGGTYGASMGASIGGDVMGYLGKSAYNTLHTSTAYENKDHTSNLLDVLKSKKDNNDKNNHPDNNVNNPNHNSNPNAQNNQPVNPANINPHPTLRDSPNPGLDKIERAIHGSTTEFITKFDQMLNKMDDINRTLKNNGNVVH